MSRSVCGRAALFGAVAVACVLASGCGGEGHRVSGKVTFNGKPVPAGKIYFFPDASKGNTGPSGYADIHDGTYDTSAPGGHAASGGPTLISIDGLDPSAKPDNNKSRDVTAKSLFPRYEIAVDLPKASSTQDVDVPASAATVKR